MSKPFDLGAAKRGEPIIARNGTPSKFVTHYPDAIGDCVVAMVGDTLLTFREDGKFFSGSDQDVDLFMAPRKVKHHAWVNLYRNGLGGSCYSDKKSAESQANDGVAEIRCIEWEVEE